MNNVITKKNWILNHDKYYHLPNIIITVKIICPRIAKPMFVKAFSHINPPMLFEIINFFSMIAGHVHHIMKVFEESTLHLHIFDFFRTM